MTAAFNLDQFADAMLVNLGERLDWEKYHMACAILVGSRSSCSRGNYKARGPRSVCDDT